MSDVNPNEFSVEADRDGDLYLVHTACGREEWRLAFTLAEIIAWAEAHECGNYRPIKSSETLK